MDRKTAKENGGNMNGESIISATPIDKVWSHPNYEIPRSAFLVLMPCMFLVTVEVPAG